MNAFRLLSVSYATLCLTASVHAWDDAPRVVTSPFQAWFQRQTPTLLPQHQPALPSRTKGRVDPPGGGSEKDDNTMTPVQPFIARGATVTGPADAELQQLLEDALRDDVSSMHEHGWWPSSGRKLLHGSRKPSRFPRCSACRAVRCSGTVCSGHCRQRRRLFDCRVTNAVSGKCLTPTGSKGGERTDAAPASFPRGFSVVITAPAPYIGCSVSADRASGCPVPGTPGQFSPDPAPEEVSSIVNSTCVTAPFEPGCGSPFMPFGVCMCYYEFTFPDTGTFVSLRPCITTVLVEWAGEVDPANEIVVEVEDGSTVTEFSYDDIPGRTPSFSYSVTVDESHGLRNHGFGDPFVTQEIYRTEGFSGRSATTEVSDMEGHDALSGDYDYN